MSAAAFAASGSSAFVPMLKPVDGATAMQHASQEITGQGTNQTSSPGFAAGNIAAGGHANVTIKAGDSLASAIIRGGVPKSQA